MLKLTAEWALAQKENPVGVTINKNEGGQTPTVDDGKYVARFDGMTILEHPKFVKDSDKFGKPDDGRRVHFGFTLLDEDGDEVYDDGDPVTVEAMTRVAFGERSNAYAIFKPLLTEAELAQFDAGEDLDGESIEGRTIGIEVKNNDKGFSNVVATFPLIVAKPKGKKPAAAAVAEAE